jgi:hypothetical protein
MATPPHDTELPLHEPRPPLRELINQIHLGHHGRLRARPNRRCPCRAVVAAGHRNIELSADYRICIDDIWDDAEWLLERFARALEAKTASDLFAYRHSPAYQPSPKT